MPHRTPPTSILPTTALTMTLAACLSVSLGCDPEEPVDDESLLDEDLEDEDALDGLPPASDELSASTSPSAVDIPWQTSAIQNLSGEYRYIKNSGSRGTKL
jgi:hypothetical protein